MAIGVGLRLLSLGLRCSLLLLGASVCFGLIPCRGISWRRFAILFFGDLVLGWSYASLFWVRFYTRNGRGLGMFYTCVFRPDILKSSGGFTGKRFRKTSYNDRQYEVTILRKE